MTFRLIYQPSEFSRIIPAICIDNRANIPAIKNAIGSVIKTYTDAEVAKIVDEVLFYKVETTEGVLAAYFSLKIIKGGTVATLLQYKNRASFSVYVTQISSQITNFINNGNWKQDYLF